MPTLTISHTHAEGTLLNGTAKGDGSYDAIKSLRRWKWSRNIGTGSWYVPGSRDRRADTYLIDRTRTALQAAGFEVTVEIDDTYRSTAEVEADKAERQADRVAALDAKADRKDGAAAAAGAAHERAHAALPPFGEPVKLGHHSQRRHEKALDTAWDKLGKSVEANRAADEAHRRADSASRTTEHRYNPGVIRRRLDKLEADKRRFERARDGYTRQFRDGNGQVIMVEPHEPATGAYRERLETDIAHLAEDIAFWNTELAKAAETGAQLWDKTTIVVGDQVYAVGSWHEVRRVNPKSITIPSIIGGSWTDTIDYSKIKSVRDANGRKVSIRYGERSVDVSAAVDLDQGVEL